MRHTCMFMLSLLATAHMAAQSPVQTEEEGRKLEKAAMETKDYIPEVHGTVRGKYEYQPEPGTSRFQVRNARFGLTGNVHPAVAYKVEIDLSDEGNIKMLDAYGRLFPLKGLSVTIGQMRVPFTIDAHRSPHQQYFANRSFIAKQAGNVRDAGVAAEYDFGQLFPLRIEAGAFNGTGLTQQKVWHKSLSYSAKAQLFPVRGMNLTLSLQSIRPDIVRIHVYDIGSYYERNGWHIEGEYLYKHYGNNAYKNAHAVNGFANYDLPLKRLFSKISFLGRYDMLTDHSNGVADEATGKLQTDNCQRHRITGGITLSLGKKAFIADIRVNYEKYFYRESSLPEESEQDKFVAELMIRF